MLASLFSHFIYVLKPPKPKDSIQNALRYNWISKMDGSTVEEKVKKLYERIKQKDGLQWFQTSLIKFFTFQ
ncbi:MAG: hypothetical protein DA329_10815 [Candidatus Nitrosocosmicus sp.]|nr:hypothetical protein [Candidatus Nitrosocosmicus sp.]